MVIKWLLYEQENPSVATKDDFNPERDKLNGILKEAGLLKLEVLLHDYLYGKRTGSEYDRQRQNNELYQQIVYLEKVFLDRVLHMPGEINVNPADLLILIRLYRQYGDKLIPVFNVFRSNKMSFFPAIGTDIKTALGYYTFLDHYTTQDIDSLMQYMSRPYQGRYGHQEQLLIMQESQKGINCFVALCDYAYNTQPNDPVAYARQLIDGFYYCEPMGIYERAINNYATHWLGGEYSIQQAFADAYRIGGEDPDYVNLILKYCSLATTVTSVIDLPQVVELIQEAQQHKLDISFFQTLLDGYASLSGRVVLPLIPVDKLLWRAQSFVAHIDAIKRVDKVCVDLDVSLNIDYAFLYRILDTNPDKLNQLLVLCKQVGYTYIVYSDIGERFYPTSRPMAQMDVLHERDSNMGLLPAMAEFAKQYEITLDSELLDDDYTARYRFTDLEMLYNCGLRSNTTSAQFRARLQLFGGTLNKYKMYKELFVDNPYAVRLYDHIQSRTDPVVLLNLGGQSLQTITITNRFESMHWFRGITQMMLSLKMKVPDNSDLAGRNAVFAQYIQILQQKIAKDVVKNKEGVPERKGKNTFKKVFFCGATGGTYKDGSKPEDHNNAFTGIGKLKEKMNLFTDDFQDFSSQVNMDNEIVVPYDPGEFEEAVDDYVQKHPDDDVCVYLAFHGGQDGSIGRFDKKLVNKLARKSPHIVLATESCHFGYSLQDPYGQDRGSDGSLNKPIAGPVSGASGMHWGYSNYMNAFVDVIDANPGIGFHEAELLARTKYFLSFTPLYDIQKLPDPDRIGKMKIVPVGITAVSDPVGPYSIVDI